MSEENTKIYVVEGVVGAKATEIIACNKDQALEIYKQLYNEGMIDLEDLETACIIKEKEILKN